MWRNKERDLTRISTFIDDLSEFKNLKDLKWEQVDEAVQMANPPATPFQDWIEPPDEELTLKKLEKDPDYVRLRKKLSGAIPELKKIARFIHFNTHHDFDWVVFTTPLIGNEALDDGLSISKQLFKACEKKSYVCGNFWTFFRK